MTLSVRCFVSEKCVGVFFCFLNKQTAICLFLARGRFWIGYPSALLKQEAPFSFNSQDPCNKKPPRTSCFVKIRFHACGWLEPNYKWVAVAKNACMGIGRGGSPLYAEGNIRIRPECKFEFCVLEGVPQMTLICSLLLGLPVWIYLCKPQELCRELAPAH